MKFLIGSTAMILLRNYPKSPVAMNLNDVNEDGWLVLFSIDDDIHFIYSFILDISD